MSSNVSRRMHTEQVDVLSPKSQALCNSYTLIIGVFEDLKTRGDINNVTEGFLIRGDTYYERLSALDHGAYAIDNTTSLLKSGLLVNKELNKNSLALKKVRGQSEATNISDQKL